MTSLQLISDNLISAISKEYNLSSNERIKVKFGMEVIAGSIFKMIVLFSTFYILGAFCQSLVAMYSFGFLRSASGGYHCNTSSKCLLVTLVIFSLIGLISNSFAITSIHYYIIAIILLLIIVYKAPVDPFQRHYKSSKRKYFMKIISALTLILLITLPAGLNLNNNFKNVILLATCFQVFTLTGYGQKTYLFIDRLNFRKNGGE